MEIIDEDEKTPIVEECEEQTTPTINLDLNEERNFLLRMERYIEDRGAQGLAFKYEKKDGKFDVSEWMYDFELPSQDELEEYDIVELLRESTWKHYGGFLHTNNAELELVKAPFREGSCIFLTDEKCIKVYIGGEWRRIMLQ